MDDEDRARHEGLMYRTGVLVGTLREVAEKGSGIVADVGIEMDADGNYEPEVLLTIAGKRCRLVVEMRD